MATQAQPVPLPPPTGIPTPAQGSPYPSPAISHPNLPNGVASRPGSNGSAPTAPPVASSASPPAGAPPNASPYFPPPGHHVSPPLQQGQFPQGHAQYGSPRPQGPQHLPQGPPHGPPTAQQPAPHQYRQQPQHHQPHPPPPPNHAPPQPTMTQAQQSHQQTPAGNQGPAQAGQPQSHQPSAQLASPNAQKAPQFSQDFLNLAELIKKTPADVVRHVIRDNWERALLGSQYHTAFLMNATLHQADSDTLSRAVQDFGGRMIKESKQHVIKHLNADDFDEVAEALLARVSNNFLDKALARRLETIPARQLVNALARAERLGYDVQDIVEEKHGTEHVIPSMPPLTLPPSLPPSMPVSTQPTPTPPIASHPTQLQYIPLQNRKPREGADGVLHCPSCDWPCSAQEALDYHIKKHACGKVKDSDRLGKDFCPHCGSRFGSAGGLAYHLKTMVCGGYSEKKAKMMQSLIVEFQDNQRRQDEAYANRLNPVPVTSNDTTPQNATPERRTTSDWVTPNNDPYSKLTPQQRADFEREMKDAEEYYGKLMREAMKLPEPEQGKQLSALKNRYNTKQSVTRKKYGIRLRERRSKAQIEAERTRLFGSKNGPSLSGRDGREGPPFKRPRVEGGQAVASPQPNGSQGERRRVPVSEMGGLSGSSATAEHSDPTVFLTASQPRHLQHQQSSPPRPVHGGGTQADPMSIDDDSSTDSDSDSDDEDIPSSGPKLP